MADAILIEWARIEAARLTTLANSKTVPDGLAATVRGRQFLSEYADGSTFQQAAEWAVSNYTAYSAQPIHEVAMQLEEWVQYQESGVADLKPFEVRFRIEAATDIMEQVRVLLKDADLHPAAPVVLAGAALEEFLRSMYEECDERLTGKPGIASYATALQKAELITRGEAKEIIAWADQRNDAAHGHFEDLSRERAKIMVEAINLFIGKHT